MRSAAIDPLARVSTATMPSRPLWGASVATHTTGIWARAARVSRAVRLADAGEGNDPVHLVADGPIQKPFFPFPQSWTGRNSISTFSSRIAVASSRIPARTSSPKRGGPLERVH